MVEIDTIFGRFSFKSYAEARKYAYSELTGSYMSAYGTISVYPNPHINKEKEILEYDKKLKMVITHRIEGKMINVYSVRRDGELGARLIR